MLLGAAWAVEKSEETEKERGQRRAVAATAGAGAISCAARGERRWRAAGKQTNEARVSRGEPAWGFLFPAKTKDDRRISSNGRDCTETKLGHFRPRRDGVFPAQAQVAAWERGAPAREMAMGRFPLTGPRASSQRRKKKKKCRAAGPLQASRPRLRFRQRPRPAHGLGQKRRGRMACSA